MQPNDIKHIINCVVDYSWPWEFYFTFSDQEGWWQDTKADPSLERLCRVIGKGKYAVRLDPDHVWSWPIEARATYPSWWRKLNLEKRRSWGIWHRNFGEYSFKTTYELQNVAIHPLTPTMEPPSGWVAEGKRILK